MKAFLHRLRSSAIAFVGTENIEKFIVFVAKTSGIDLLLIAYHQRGILKYWDLEVSGEKYVLEQVLNKYLPQEKSIIFDVGANVGDYSKDLKKEFPSSTVYAFEPNSNTYKLLIENLSEHRVKCFCLGLSSSKENRHMYTYSSELTSGHASLYKDVLSDLHSAENVSEVSFSAVTIDKFCSEHQIERINFLKVDTEGHELEVLTGGQEMLKDSRIDIIQFEFNEMNVISRVFLKDFYNLLDKYQIYRVDSKRLIPMFDYKSGNEIFQFQNLLAIRIDLVEET